MTLLSLSCLLCLPAGAGVRDRLNFNPGWLLHVGDVGDGQDAALDDSGWEAVSLPRAFNEDEAFRVPIHDLTDTVAWYRKHFRLPRRSRGRKVFLEFEGVRQAADFYVNGHHVALHENGVMAVGIDVTPYVDFRGENVVAVRVDNDWEYAERSTGTRFQWNDINFNANYGGIVKNAWLHVTDRLYQTLPLYSDLGTRGVYVYADGIDVGEGSAVVHAESEVRNERERDVEVTYRVELLDMDGATVASFDPLRARVGAGETVTLESSSKVRGLHFWSVGYGYLYVVRTSLWVGGRKVDEVSTRTGFRKTGFGEGKVFLNDRAMQVKGFAQRTSNEWPAVGMSVPAWLSDFGNSMMVDCGANLVRWMHVTPWKQDVESCDRVGLMQAMPAGDAEDDSDGRPWEMRKELMRDAIVYNRNNPSVIFYECGNRAIQPAHMAEMMAIRDEYDPHGGRAMGSREMLGGDGAEYGGEMLYVNKSAGNPLWAMEYCRDEGLRKYWDDWSPPYHANGDATGTDERTMAHLERSGDDCRLYNRNQDSLAIEHVARWHDFWRERPGTGTRVSAGGAKIVFSDTNTHFRGAENYRRSGVVDPMRLPKASYFAHGAMWDGWVDTETPGIYIIGHWNYGDGVVKPVNVVSGAESVELFLNGRSLGLGERSHGFLFSFGDVAFEPGELLAVGYGDDGGECCRASVRTAGEPRALRLLAHLDPCGWRADGADMALLEVEVVDSAGARCPVATDTVRFEVDGPAEWRGGIAQGEGNFILSRDLPVECGVNRALLRSTATAGKVRVRAEAVGLEPAEILLETLPFDAPGGLSPYIQGDHLPGRLARGETPRTPSYVDRKVDVPIAGALAGANQEDAWLSYDDNELTEWRNDGREQTAWITYRLGRRAVVDEICMKLTGWRLRSYPLEVLSGDELLWSGETPRSLGYVHLDIPPACTDEVTIRLGGQGGNMGGEREPATGRLDLYGVEDGDRVGGELRIVEIEFKESL